MFHVSHLLEDILEGGCDGAVPWPQGLNSVSITSRADVPVPLDPFNCDISRVRIFEATELSICDEWKYVTCTDYQSAAIRAHMLLGWTCRAVSAVGRISRCPVYFESKIQMMLIPPHSAPHSFPCALLSAESSFRVYPGDCFPTNTTKWGGIVHFCRFWR